MIGNVTEMNTADSGNVMKELALVLGKVTSVRLNESAPQPTVQNIELFGRRFVRHGVQSTPPVQEFVRR